MDKYFLDIINLVLNNFQSEFANLVFLWDICKYAWLINFGIKTQAIQKRNLVGGSI